MLAMASHSASTKCGASQGTAFRFSGTASGRTKLRPGASSSTRRVTVTPPILHCSALPANSIAVMTFSQLHRRKTQIAQEDGITIGFGVGRGEQFLSIEDGVGPSKKTEHHCFTRHLSTACSHAHHGARHNNPGRSNGADHNQGIQITLL